MKRLLQTLAVLGGVALGGLAMAAAPVAAAEGQTTQAKQVTVIELFTSQGCSSCPPADELLGELDRRDDILALSFHVDYWDYIGWKDPFASPLYTQRQRDYARRFDLSYVYTPQAVIQGAAQEVGSHRGPILKAIERAKKLSRVPVTLSHAGKDGKLMISIPARSPAEKADVLMVVIDRTHETPVKRGENSGRMIKNFNVVRAIRRIGTWDGKALEISTSLADMSYDGGDYCVVMVQSTTTGRILGAAKLALFQGN